MKVFKLFKAVLFVVVVIKSSGQRMIALVVVCQRRMSACIEIFYRSNIFRFSLVIFVKTNLVIHSNSSSEKVR